MAWRHVPGWCCGAWTATRLEGIQLDHAATLWSCCRGNGNAKHAAGTEPYMHRSAGWHGTNLGSSQDTLWCSQTPPECCQAQVPDLDHPTCAIHKDVVTLEVTVDDSWLMCMQVHQPLQDLPCPTLQHLLINVLMLLAVPGIAADT